MKCPNCSGTGIVEKKSVFQQDAFNCPYCHGTGNVKQTKEEWLKSASTEELAEFLIQIYKDGRNDRDNWYERCEANCELWLNEKHETAETADN